MRPSGKSLLGKMLPERLLIDFASAGFLERVHGNELIKIVETETSRKLKYHQEPFLVEEAEALYAGKPLLDRFIPLKEGVKEVAESLRSSAGK